MRRVGVRAMTVMKEIQNSWATYLPAIKSGLNCRPLSIIKCGRYRLRRGPACLYVRFIDGETYEYFNVPVGDFLGLLKAKSIGRFVNKHIKP